MLIDLVAFATNDLPPGIDPSDVKPGWLGLAVIAGIGVVLVFLMFSFAKHVRKAREPWEGEESGGEESEPGAPETD